MINGFLVILDAVSASGVEVGGIVASWLLGDSVKGLDLLVVLAVFSREDKVFWKDSPLKMVLSTG